MNLKTILNSRVRLQIKNYISKDGKMFLSAYRPINWLKKHRKALFCLDNKLIYVESGKFKCYEKENFDQ